MVETDHHGSAMTLRDYLHVVRRRKWIIIMAVVLVPAAAIALLAAPDEALPGERAGAAQRAEPRDPARRCRPDVGSLRAPDRDRADAGARRARARSRRARVATGSPRPVPSARRQFLANSGVSAAANADLLTFSVTNHSPTLSTQLVNAYAAAYTVYRRQLDTASIKKALHGVNASLDKLQAAGQDKSRLYNALLERQQTLLTIAALQTSNATVVQRASEAVKTQPKTTRNAILGVVLGLVLGLGLAFLRESLDTRVRSAEEIGERLGRIPLLARVAAPPKRFAGKNRLAMVDEPYGPQAEAFRILRTNLDFACLGREIRSVMITSAVEQEGKSTTIANLAVALARTGKRVVLVDLDLRRPFLHRFFGLEGAGVTQVALGHATLEAALVPIALAEPVAPADDGEQ